MFSLPFPSLYDYAKNTFKDTYDRVSTRLTPIIKSSLGSLATRAVFTAGASWVGAAIGGKVTGYLSKELVPCVFHRSIGPALVTASAYTGISSVKNNFKSKNQVLIAGLTFLMAALQSNLFSDETRGFIYVALGQWAGETLGSILGGYFMLQAHGYEAPLIDPQAPTNSYLTNMLKYNLTGVAFDALTYNMRGSLKQFPIGIIPSSSRFILQNIACYSEEIPALLQKFSSREVNPQTIRRFLSEFAQKNCIDESSEISKRLLNLSGVYLPPIVFQPILEMIVSHFGKEIPDLGIAFLRGLSEYLQEIQTSDPSKIIEELVPESYLAKTINYLAIDSLTNFLSKWLVTLIRNKETGIAGFQISSSDQLKTLEKKLNFHIRNAFIHTLNNYGRLKEEDLKNLEKRQLFNRLVEAALSFYVEPTYSRLTAKTIRFGGTLIDKAARIVERRIAASEQSIVPFDQEPAIIRRHARLQKIVTDEIDEEYMSVNVVFKEKDAEEQFDSGDDSDIVFVDQLHVIPGAAPKPTLLSRISKLFKFK